MAWAGKRVRERVSGCERVTGLITGHEGGEEMISKLGFLFLKEPGYWNEPHSGVTIYVAR